MQGREKLDVLVYLKSKLYRIWYSHYVLVNFATVFGFKVSLELHILLALNLTRK